MDPQNSFQQFLGKFQTDPDVLNMFKHSILNDCFTSILYWKEI